MQKLSSAESNSPKNRGRTGKASKFEVYVNPPRGERVLLATYTIGEAILQKSTALAKGLSLANNARFEIWDLHSNKVAVYVRGVLVEGELLKIEKLLRRDREEKRKSPKRKRTV